MPFTTLNAINPDFDVSTGMNLVSDQKSGDGEFMKTDDVIATM